MAYLKYLTIHITDFYAPEWPDFQFMQPKATIFFFFFFFFFFFSGMYMVGKFLNREKYATKVQVVCWDFFNF
jgi:hypothetical protein